MSKTTQKSNKLDGEQLGMQSYCKLDGEHVTYAWEDTLGNLHVLANLDDSIDLYPMDQIEKRQHMGRGHECAAILIPAKDWALILDKVKAGGTG